jgi:uncharacterized membrane protein
MFETEIPERRAVKNRHHFIYMSGVYLSLAILHATLFFWHPNFNRGWNLAASLIWILICIKNYKTTIDEPEQTKMLDLE